MILGCIWCLNELIMPIMLQSLHSHFLAGINVHPLSQYYSGVDTPIQSGILLGFACVQEQDMTFAFSILGQCSIENRC